MSEPETPFNPNDDPNAEDFEAVERVLRIGQLRAELAELTGEPLAEYIAEDTPMDTQEAFLKNMLAFENAPQIPMADLLKQRRNFTPVPLARLKDPIDLKENLWTLIYVMASVRIFLHDTDHLSDRELYQALLEDVLPEASSVLPEGAGWNCNYSICELTDGKSESNDCYLRYYASDEDRDFWEEQYPEDPTPPSEEPPFDRDQYLPGPGY